jgi:hypothetical protein
MTIETEKEQYESQIQTLKENCEKQIQIQKEQYEKQIQTLEKQLEEFKNQIFEIAKQPKQIYNTKNNQRTLNIVEILAVYNLNKEEIKHVLKEQFTIQTFHGGPKAIMEVVNTLIVDPETQKSKLICTDINRQTFKYINEDREMKTDPKCKNTYNLIKGPTMDMNSQICKEILRDQEEKKESINQTIKQFTKNEEFIKDKNKFVCEMIAEIMK